MPKKLLHSICALLALCAPEVDGSTLSLAWGIPFAGMLLSIALFPILAAHIWHHNFGKITGRWTLAFLVPFTIVFGGGTTVSLVAHAMLAEFIRSLFCCWRCLPSPAAF